MEAALQDEALDSDDRLHLHFALGKAHEDRGADEIAWTHYAASNTQRADELGHDPDRIAGLVDRSIALFDAPFFAAHAGQGYPTPDPIFILECRARDRRCRSRSCRAIRWSRGR